MSDPGIRSKEPSTWAWEELDDTYLLGEVSKQEDQSLEGFLKLDTSADSTGERIDGMNSDSGIDLKEDDFTPASPVSRKSPLRLTQQNSGKVVRSEKEATVDADRKVQPQRQDYARTDSESSIDQNERETCDCTECRSSRWRGEDNPRPGQSVSIKSRLNGISF